jgi:DNA-directed RNA polymerase sigma subunit (sigma70/sigma32)
LDDTYKWTRDDAIFFMDMVGSTRSPNFVPPQLGKVKPYKKIVKEKDSIDTKRFIGLYKSIRHRLNEREVIILNEMYGVDKESPATLKTVGQLLNISPERVRQISSLTERNIVWAMLKELEENPN